MTSPRNNDYDEALFLALKEDRLGDVKLMVEALLENKTISHVNELYSYNINSERLPLLDIVFSCYKNNKNYDEYADLAEWLISKGAQLDQLDTSSQEFISAFCKVVGDGNRRFVNLYLAANANPNSILGGALVTPLVVAIDNYDVEMFNDLLQHSRKLNFDTYSKLLSDISISILASVLVSHNETMIRAYIHHRLDSGESINTIINEIDKEGPAIKHVLEFLKERGRFPAQHTSKNFEEFATFIDRIITDIKNDIAMDTTIERLRTDPTGATFFSKTVRDVSKEIGKYVADPRGPKSK